MCPFRRRKFRSFSRSGFTRALRYSQEHGTFWTQVQNASGPNSHMSIPVVAQSGTAGVRKVKNIKLDMVSEVSVPTYWAILYIPDGISADPPLNVGVLQAGASIYEPNQHVMMYGVCSSFSPTHQFSSLSRNLNGNDQVILVCQAIADGPQINLRGVVSFVIAFN